MYTLFMQGQGHGMGKALKAYVPRYVSRQGVEETEKESASADCASGICASPTSAPPPPNISSCTSEWLSFPRPSAARSRRRSDRASRGRVPEVSLHTAVKGQFGLGTGRAMGKALKTYVPRYVSRQGVEETKKKSASAGCASYTKNIFHEYLASPSRECLLQGEKLASGRRRIPQFLL